MTDDTALPVSGELLVANFQTVLTSQAITEAAKYEAARSESALMNELDSLGRAGYLNPGTITPGQQPDLSRESLDAHIKKIQAQQLESLSVQQLGELIAQTRARYLGHKVAVLPLNYKDAPVESVWFDPATGYRGGQVKRKKIAGTIEDLLLDQNLLVIKPTRGMQLLNPQLQNYVVYVIDPSTFQPLVNLIVW